MVEWRILSPEEVADEELHRCRETRGPRSKVECEEDMRQHLEFHVGRGNFGQWFFWEMKEK